MAEQVMNDEEKLKQLAKKMRENEYKGLTEEEIKEKEQQKEMRRQKNIQILNDTLSIFEKGSYIKDQREVQLHFSSEDRKKIQVFLPDDIASLSKEDFHMKDNHSCILSCENVNYHVQSRR